MSENFVLTFGERGGGGGGAVEDTDGGVGVAADGVVGLVASFELSCGTDMHLTVKVVGFVKNNWEDGVLVVKRVTGLAVKTDDVAISEQCTLLGND